VWVQSIKDQSKEEILSKLDSWLMPQTDGFFEAPSGHRLHVRAVVPPSDPSALKAKAVLLHFHGMNSHNNGRNWAVEFFPRLAQQGYVLFAVDMMGHGYSEGERALVEDWEDVFEDMASFAEELYGVSASPARPEDFHSGVCPEVLNRVRQLPLFLHGQSLGGMICLGVGLRLQRSQKLEKGIFRGALLAAPALQVPLPPQAVISFLKWCVVPCCSRQPMPEAVSSSSKVHLGANFDLSDPKQKYMAEMEVVDCAHRFPKKGLGWFFKMRWGTASAYSTIFSAIDEEMKEVRFPFQIIHDPKDSICMVEGSEKLMKLSACKDKVMHRVDAGGLHVLTFVIQEEYLKLVGSWIQQHL